MSGVAAVADVASIPVASPSTQDQRDQAAQEATNPLPFKEQLGFKPMYTFPDGATRYKAQLEFEPVLPFRGPSSPAWSSRGSGPSRACS
jgi:hypothetical protein